MKNMLLTVASAIDETYVPINQSSCWAYWIIGAGVLAVVVSVAFLISKKIK